MILVFLLTESCEIKYTINKWIWRNNMFKKGKRLNWFKSQGQISDSSY